MNQLNQNKKMIFDKQLRAKVKAKRDAIYDLLQGRLPDHELTLIGDSEIQITFNVSDYSIRSTGLECNMYGDWQFIEYQDESGSDNHYYDTNLNLNYTSNPKDVVNKLIELI